LSKIIAVVNQKGGVGKTTTAVNISSVLAKKGKKVLLIDEDPQGNATSGLGVDKNTEKSIYDVIINDVEINEAIVQSPIKNLWVCPSNINLAGAEVELVPMMARESRLKEKLEKVENDFHYIIIDCPPSLGLLTINALTASNSLLVPIQCEYYALEGVGQLMNTVNLIKKQLNKDLYIEGVVLTMNDARTNLSNQVINEVKTFFKDNVYKTIIPRNVKLSEAPSFGMPISVYAPKSKGARCYEKLTNEIMKNTRK
jgi:chromosome partitioning protein